MKDKALVYLSLLTSITALCYAAWVHQHAEQMAEQALKKRERQFVQAFAPKIRETYRDLGMTNTINNPTTLDDLFGPFLEGVNRLSQNPGNDEKK